MIFTGNHSLQMQIQAGRARNMHREAVRHAQADAEFQKEMVEIDHLQTRNVHLKNKGGEEYNILTFAYNSSPGGDAMKKKVSIFSSTLICHVFSM